MPLTSLRNSFSLAYLVFNTIGNLTTQDQQVACFQNVASHLEPGGCFVIEVVVPDLQGLPHGETFRPVDVSEGHLGIDEYEDRKSTRLNSSHGSISYAVFCLKKKK